ncbi:metallophosphoesterase [Nitrosospira briensis]|uniref:metallophosphoesterase n=1 Tax=Nitrosospira briensis TaxID=35799 RepID=UPI0012E24E26|nr:metallophosphoesterase [Nitrosospira briensis]
MSVILTDLINARNNIKTRRDTDELLRRTVRLAVAIWNDCGGADNFTHGVEALKYFRNSCDTCGIRGLEEFEKIGVSERARINALCTIVTNPGPVLVESIDLVLKHAEASRTGKFSHKNVQQLDAVQAKALQSYEHQRGRVFVCSDIHLGTGEAGHAQLLEVMGLCQEGDTLILLGDVLDAWIYDSPESSLKAVIEWWQWLYWRLKDLAENNVIIHYVMGNHDAFVFPLHAKNSVKLCKRLVEKSNFLQCLENTVDNYNLQSVATLHSVFMWCPKPLLSPTASQSGTCVNEPILLTHGHMTEWWWAWSAGSAEVNVFAERPLAMTSIAMISSALLLDARETVRGVWKYLSEGIPKGRRMTDVAALVTLETLEEYILTKGMPDEEFVDFVDGAWTYLPMMADRVIQSSRIGKGIEQLDRWYNKRDLEDIRVAHEVYLARNQYQQHFTLKKGEMRRTPLTSTYGSYRNFCHLIFGHYHQPQLIEEASGAKTIDDGALLDGRPGVITALQINPNGSIGFLPGLSS